jgi:NAD(P)-dependent dehydrogenase (short-subunit alcohol dehydrogenase family)
MHPFKDHVAMVTGGATGIGAAIVERLASEGIAVACCYNRSRAAAESLAERMRPKGTDIFLSKVDVSDGREVSATVESIAKHYGRPISILINNAGDIIESAPIEAMEEGLWDAVMDVNLRGAFLCAKHCIPGMKQARAGRIVNVSSISARSGGGPGAAHYAASKGGVEAFTRALAKELAPFRITANAVSPGVIDTPIHQRHNTPEGLERLRQLIPLQRIGLAEEVAGVVAFLVSADAAYITGEVIAVNGGMRMD